MTIMKKLEKVTFEKFSFKKYQKYQEQGLPVRLVTGRGVEVHIIAEHVGLNKDMFVVETEVQYYHATDAPYVKWFGVKPNGVIDGCSERNSNDRVYIQHGCIDLQEGDIVLQASSDSGFYFMYMLTQIACLEGKGKPGFFVKHGVDMYGGQYHSCGIFHDTDYHECYMRVATPEEEAKYWQLLEDNGIRRNEDETMLLFFPKIGQPYWTIELENGEYKVVEHDAPTCQEERPRHSMCFSSYRHAQHKLEELTKK